MDTERQTITKTIEDGDIIIATFPKAKTTDEPKTDWAAEWKKTKTPMMKMKN